jgi:hypothetical protein
MSDKDDMNRSREFNEHLITEEYQPSMQYTN